MNLLMREEILTETVSRFYIAQSVLAIESIHKHNYIHRLVGEFLQTIARQKLYGKVATNVILVLCGLPGI